MEPSRQGVIMFTSQQKTCKVLFLCSGYPARSIMAAALLNTMWSACSAGGYPVDAIKPLVRQRIHATADLLNDLRSKSWGEFATPDAGNNDQG
jgi:arsenate reductase